MDDTLREAFRQYVQTATSKLRRAGRPDNSSTSLEANRGELRQLVDELERKGDFSKLAAETLNSASALDRIPSIIADALPADLAEWSVRAAVGTFFRRSECYVNLFEDKPLDIGYLFESYKNAFRNSQVQTRYLAPLAFVDFGVRSLSLSGFHIRKFSATELSEVLNNRLNNVFYPLAAADVNGLEEYWFLDVTDSRESLVPMPIVEDSIEMDHSPSIRMEFLQFAAPVEMGIRLLTLWDWDAWSMYGFESQKYRKKPKHKWEPGKGWTRIDVPFVLSISTDLLSPTGRMPEIQPFPYYPQFDQETGDELGDAPMYDLQPSEDEALRFAESLGGVGITFTRLRAHQNEWPFLEIALSFFVKAFFSEGLQQLLWHITVLEALFGEDKPGLTNMLGRRIAAVLGNDDEERNNIKKAFEELYKFRSNLVHGNANVLKQQVYVGHLREARHFPRRSLLWFLHCLDHILTEVAKSGSIRVHPSRESVLSVLDLSDGAKRIIELLPAGFPSISRWRTL
jgi:hypothetical protein